MNLKQVLLDYLSHEQLKEACAELDVEADRRSADAMVEALASARRAKPEKLIDKLTVQQLRDILGEHELLTSGRKEELIERLLVAGGRLAGDGDETPAAAKKRNTYDPPQPSTTVAPEIATEGMAQYRHLTEAIQRPDAGVQDQFQARKPPKTYRYDSSLDPALSWDEQWGRDLGEWLLGLIVRATQEGEAEVFAEPQVWQGGGVRVTSLADAARALQSISASFLNWAGKAERHEIRVPTVPLFVHERHSTKAILDGIRHRKARGQTLDLFGDAQMDIRENLEAYEHKGPWQNRMILGDSLSVMNSLLEFEGLGGQVQMIYIDPPYGVKFGSNFQPFVRKRDVKHGGDEDMTREPEMVKAYRDTWELGLHSYLTYLRDRLVVSRELLSETGSVFVQISDEHLHKVRLILDEVFGSENFVCMITVQKAPYATSDLLPSVADFLLWYARRKNVVKYRPLFRDKAALDSLDLYRLALSPDGAAHRPLTKNEFLGEPLPDGWKRYRLVSLVSPGASSRPTPFRFKDREYLPPTNSHWKTTVEGLTRVGEKRRIQETANSIQFRSFVDDFPVSITHNVWTDTITGSFNAEKLYVVQTNPKVVERCMLMCTDPGDLVLDPTCGSGTTAYVAEQWGRRWITIDTSRVPLALARQRLLTATFPYYELKSPQTGPQGGFVYKRKQNRKGEEVGGLVPHITLKSIANDEPPAMEVLVDRPEEVSGVTRVSGPFLVEATIAPAQPLDSSDESAPVTEGDVAQHLQRMTEVLRQSRTLRLPGNRELNLEAVRRTADTEFLHAEAKEGDRRVAIVFGPQDGAISAATVYEAGREAHYLRYDRLYFFGFAVEPNARSMIDDERKLRIPATYVAVTPDVAMSDLLKTSRSSEIFSVTGLPDFDVRRARKKGPDGEALWEVELRGLDLFNPDSMETESIDGAAVPCWMLDTDYDGLSFYATQVFFPKTSAWDNLQRSLRATFDDSVWEHLAGTVSEPFAIGDRRRVAVKVIDERGNELLRVRDVTE